jgi:hypothetical protein
VGGHFVVSNRADQGRRSRQSPLDIGQDQVGGGGGFLGKRSMGSRDWDDRGMGRLRRM